MSYTNLFILNSIANLCNFNQFDFIFLITKLGISKHQITIIIFCVNNPQNWLNSKVNTVVVFLYKNNLKLTTNCNYILMPCAILHILVLFNKFC